MEASRRLLLERQHAPQWLNFLGVPDSHSLPASGSFTLADVCGGTGAVSRWLLAANASISATVIDDDAASLTLGRTLAVSDGMSERIEFRLSDAASISMDDNSVECSFIHGAFHLLDDGEQTLAEMVRISRKRVAVFCADMDYVAPLDRGECLTPFDDDISELERDILGVASRDFLSMNLPGAALLHEQVPVLLAKLGCRQIFVRGIMGTVDFDELEPEEHEAYRRTEANEMIARVKAHGASDENGVNDLIELYEKRLGFLVERHKKGKRQFNWTGGPIVIWIGNKG